MIKPKFRLEDVKGGLDLARVEGVHNFSKQMHKEEETFCFGCGCNPVCSCEEHCTCDNKESSRSGNTCWLYCPCIGNKDPCRYDPGEPSCSCTGD
jgi:hypothetical protein